VALTCRGGQKSGLLVSWANKCAMEFGPDDLVMLGLRYLPSLLSSIIVCAAILGIIGLARRRFPKFRHWPALSLCVLATPLICWLIYLASTCKLAYTLTLLNSESSQVAERTYENRFRMEVGTLGAAVRIAVSKREAPNVRFYASCLVADMLAAKDGGVVAKTLANVDGAPMIETQFFGGNRLTDAFYVPGHMQPQLSVRTIVEKRLESLREAAQPVVSPRAAPVPPRTVKP
jgi:hypothetical protein